MDDVAQRQLERVTRPRRFYPWCGEPQFEDAEVDTLLNPTVLVEVLSPTMTEIYPKVRFPAADEQGS